MTKPEAGIATHAERDAHIRTQTASLRTQAEHETRRLQRQISAMNAECEQAIAELQSGEEQLSTQLATAIADEFHATAAPLIAKWIAQPARAIAIALRDAYRDADARARAEVGEELWEGVIAVAFASELVKTNPNAANVFGFGDGRIVEICAGWTRSFDQGVGNVERQLAALEAGLQALAASATEPVHESNRARLELKKSCATHGDMSRKLEAFDLQFEKERLAAFAASYVPPDQPEPFHRRAVKALEALVT